MTANFLINSCGFIIKKSNSVIICFNCLSTKESFDQRDFTASVRTCHKRPYSKREDMSKDFTTGKMLVLVSGGMK